MRLCKFSLFVYFLFNQSISFGLFEGRDCLKSQFNIQVSHKGPPLGFLLNKLKIKKKNCVIIVEKEKLRLVRSKWEFDVCRYPIHIKEGTGAVKVHKKLRKNCDFSTENKDSFCNSLKDLKNAISDYGLIFAQGEKENLLSYHGKVYCTFLLVNFYFDEEKIFSFTDEKKTSRYFGNLTKIKTYLALKEKEKEKINDGPDKGLEEKPEEKADKKTSKGMGSSKLKVIKEVIEEKPLDGTSDNQNEAKETEDPGVF